MAPWTLIRPERHTKNMRIYLSCMRCLIESGKPSPEMFAAELEESGLYRMKCGRGHETVTCLQLMKFG
jgi:hypothetical protein